MKVGAKTVNPLMRKCGGLNGFKPTTNCPYPGIDAESIDHILSLANISYEIIQVPTEMGWGEVFNGSWSGALSLMGNGTVDVLCPPLSTESRSDDSEQFLVSTYPFRQNSIWFLVLKVGYSASSSANLVFQIFQPSFWLSLGMAFLLLTLGLIISQRRSKENTTWAEVVFAIFRLFIGQAGEELRLKPIFGKLLFVQIAFLSLLSASLYQGCLLSFLLVSGHGVSPFQNTAELVGLIESGTYRFLDNRGSPFSQLLSDTSLNNSILMGLQNGTREHGVVVLSNAEDVRDIGDMLVQRKLVYPTTRLRGIQVIQSNLVIFKFHHTVQTRIMNENLFLIDLNSTGS